MIYIDPNGIEPETAHFPSRIAILFILRAYTKIYHLLVKYYIMSLLIPQVSAGKCCLHVLLDLFLCRDRELSAQKVSRIF